MSARCGYCEHDAPDIGPAWDKHTRTWVTCCMDCWSGICEAWAKKHPEMAKPGRWPVGFLADLEPDELRGPTGGAA